MADNRQLRRLLLGAAVVSAVLLETLRVLAPSLVRAGDAGLTAGLVAAAIGCLVFALPLLLAAGVERFAAHRLWLGGGLALAAGRTVLVFAPGGTTQLAGAAVAVAGAGLALTGLAAGSPSDTDRHARLGVLCGVAAATTLHVVTATRGLIWPDDPLAVAGSAVVVVAVLAVLRPVGRVIAAARGGEPVAAAWIWWSLAPLLALTGMVTGVPGRVAIATGWDSGTVAVTVAIGQVAAVTAALLVPRIGGLRAGVGAALLVLVGTVLGLEPVGWRGVSGQLALAVGLGAVIGSRAPRSHAAVTAAVRRRALTTAGALAAAAAAVSVYYLAYQLPIPGDNRIVLLALAMVAVGLGLGVAVTTNGRPVDPRIDVSAVLRLVVAAGLVLSLAGLGGRVETSSAVLEADGDLRVATYNVRSGFDPDTRFDPAAQAHLLREYAPDVVVLNEVDRGWLATGGHDLLTIFAAELGLPHVRFGGAADEVFGNALLSRYPVTEFVSEPLPRGRDPMPRGSIAAVLELHDGDSIGVVGTQLSQADDPAETRLPQARAVAATVARLRERQVPTVVVGDLYAGADTAELASFSMLVDDVLPAGTATFPADAPTEHRSHVLASPDLRRLRTDIPEVPASPHLPVVVTLRRIPGL